MLVVDLEPQRGASTDRLRVEAPGGLYEPEQAVAEQSTEACTVEGVVEEPVRGVALGLAELLEVVHGDGDASVGGRGPAEITMSEVGQALVQRGVVVPEVVREVQVRGDGSEQVYVV